MIPKYSRVKLTTNKHENDGGRTGMLGYVIESYDDGNYEVEFSDSSGVTIAQFVANEDDLLVVPECESTDHK
jgi:hypothetical protein